MWRCAPAGIWQGWGAKKLYDDLKLKIDFDPTGNEVETKLQQYLVAGQLPDLVGLKGLDQAQHGEYGSFCQGGKGGRG